MYYKMEKFGLLFVLANSKKVVKRTLPFLLIVVSFVVLHLAPIGCTPLLAGLPGLATGLFVTTGVPVMQTIAELKNAKEGMVIEPYPGTAKVQAIRGPVRGVLVWEPSDNMGQKDNVASLLHQKFGEAGIVPREFGVNIAMSSPAQGFSHIARWTSGKLDQQRNGGAVITTGFFELVILSAEDKKEEWREKYKIWIKNVPIEKVYEAATSYAVESFRSACAGLCVDRMALVVQ